MLLLLAFGCTSDEGKVSESGDTGYAWRDTAAVDSADSDTDTDTDTGDSTRVDTSESGETAIVDTSESGDTGEPPPMWLSLQAWPASMVVFPGASWTLRVIGTDADGVTGELPDDRGAATFTVDDAAVASVDADGVVTALAEGTTTIRISMGGLEATCAVEVRADGVATITVLDGSTGLPIESARVALPFTSPVYTDASGVALLPVTDAGPLTFSAWVDDSYDALTVTGVVGRALTVSILPKDTDPRSATLTGAIDYTGVGDAGWSDLVVGIAGGSIQGSLAATKLEDLFAEERTITVFGVEAEAPSNLFVEGSADTYASVALPGAVGVWGLAGPIAIADATSGLSGSGDALQLLADNLDVMTWGHVTGLTATADAETTADLAPASTFDDLTPVSLPPLPAGFYGDESYFVLVTEERADEGFLLTGLGTGTPAATTDIASVLAGTVADSLGTSVLAYAQVGGVGSGGAVSAGVGTREGSSTVIVPLLQSVPTVTTWDPSARTFGFSVDDSAHFVRVRLRDSRNRVHDILAPGDWSGDIPNCVNSFGLASAEIEILAVETTAGAYESWLAGGELDPTTFPVATAARATQE
jgi:hypothetical protein